MECSAVLLFEHFHGQIEFLYLLVAHLAYLIRDRFSVCRISTVKDSVKLICSSLTRINTPLVFSVYSNLIYAAPPFSFKIIDHDVF
jgi:hypothetical protein